MNKRQLEALYQIVEAKCVNLHCKLVEAKERNAGMTLIEVLALNLKEAREVRWVVVAIMEKDLRLIFTSSEIEEWKERTK